MSLKRIYDSRRRGLSPDDIDQPAGTDDLTAVQRQNSQYCPAPETAHRPRLAFHCDIN